jgi:hypothetical protein
MTQDHKHTPEWRLSFREVKVGIWNGEKLPEWHRSDGLIVCQTIGTFPNIKPWVIRKGSTLHYIPHTWRFKTAESAMSRADVRVPLAAIAAAEGRS